MSGFAVDTTKPAPGPWRMPRDTERRCRVYFAKPFRDCIDVCEVNPDLEETTDATMRVIVAAPDMLEALRAVLSVMEDPLRHLDLNRERADVLVRAAIAKAEGRKP